MKGRYEKIADAILGYLLAVAIIALIFLCLLCGGCTRKVYVPMETERTEYKDRVQVQTRIDSVFQRDSISVFINGDTVRIEKWRDRIKYRDREVHDTLVLVFHMWLSAISRVCLGYVNVLLNLRTVFLFSVEALL